MKFQVRLERVTYSTTTVVVEAETELGAKALAEQDLIENDGGEWIVWEDNILAEEAEEL